LLSLFYLFWCWVHPSSIWSLGLIPLRCPRWLNFTAFLVLTACPFPLVDYGDWGNTAWIAVTTGGLSVWIDLHSFLRE
jgi:hypothetical protein